MSWAVFSEGEAAGGGRAAGRARKLAGCGVRYTGAALRVTVTAGEPGVRDMRVARPGPGV